MDIKKLTEIQDKIIEVEEDLSIVYHHVLDQRQGQVNETTGAMSEILKIAEDLKNKMKQFLAAKKIDSS